MTLHEFDIRFVVLPDGLAVSATKPNHRSLSLTPGRAGHTPVNFSDIVNPLLATSDGRDGMISYTIWSVSRAGSVLFVGGWVLLAWSKA